MKDQILQSIVERAAKIWGVAPETMNADTAFADMNPKSAHYAQLTTFLENQYDLEVPYMSFKRCKTFGEAAGYVADLLDE